MNPQPVPQPLAEILEAHCNVNAYSANWPDALLRELRHAADPQRRQLFRAQLANAILQRAITPEQYEALTGEDFDTPAELNLRLRELWQEVFGDTAIE